MGDLNVFDHLFIEGTYGFIAYDGNDNTIRDVQEEQSPYGLAISASIWAGNRNPELVRRCAGDGAYRRPMSSGRDQHLCPRLTGYSSTVNRFEVGLLQHQSDNLPVGRDRDSVANALQFSTWQI